VIVEGSRYASALVVRVTLSDGTYQWAVLGERWATPQTIRYRYRTTQQGDRMDMLASQEYGDPLLWWVIARANPEVFYPDEIPVGTVIRIPDASVVR
jgi:hypothetical protein